MNKVVILGASGHAKVIADIIIKSRDSVVGFLDDNTNLPNKIVGFPYLGTISEITKFSDDICFIIGIGDNQVRKRISDKYSVRWYTAIHPGAVIGFDTKIGEGTVVMANAVINVSTVVGKHCIINTGSILEHDNRIEDYVHISPNATLSGSVSVGTMTQIGAGATIRNNMKICNNCIIGAGAVVVKDIEISGTYIGVPAKNETRL